MLHRWRPLVACLSLLPLLTAAGCNPGSEGGQSPPAAIDGHPAAGENHESGPSKPAADPQHPVVRLETSVGNISVELDREKAQLTVDNFLSYVGASHYDLTIVHQVYKGQLFLAGGYGTNLLAKPTHTPVFNEAHNGLKNRRGTIAMARLPDDIHSATCQFFINVVDNPALDHKDRSDDGYGYCVFGRVTDGMNVADQIAAAKVQDTREFDRTPVEPILIRSIRRIR